MESIPEIPADYELTATQEVVRRATVTREPWVAPGRRAALDGLAWPRFYAERRTAMPGGGSARPC